MLALVRISSWLWFRVREYYILYSLRNTVVKDNSKFQKLWAAARAYLVPTIAPGLERYPPLYVAQKVSVTFPSS